MPSKTFFFVLFWHPASPARNPFNPQPLISHLKIVTDPVFSNQVLLTCPRLVLPFFLNPVCIRNPPIFVAPLFS